MRRTLITGAGGPAAVCLFRSLSESGVPLVMGDMDPLSPGLYLVGPQDRLHLLPGNTPGFAAHLLAHAIARGIERIFCTVDAELLPLSRHRDAFDDAGIELVLPSHAALRSTLDKYALVQACQGILPVPATRLGSQGAPEGHGDVIVKPRQGSGSRGVRQVDRRTLEPLDDTWLIQEHLPGMEYSVDVLLDRGGRAYGSVPRERLRVDSGVAITARTVQDPWLQAYAVRAARRMKLAGIVNVQFKKDASGIPRLLEINPRVPGTLALTIAAGADLPKMWWNLLEGRAVLPTDFREIAIVRTYAEHIVDVGVFDALAKTA